MVRYPLTGTPNHTRSGLTARKTPIITATKDTGSTEGQPDTNKPVLRLDSIRRNIIPPDRRVLLLEPIAPPKRTGNGLVTQSDESTLASRLGLTSDRSSLSDVRSAEFDPPTSGSLVT